MKTILTFTFVILLFSSLRAQDSKHVMSGVVLLDKTTVAEGATVIVQQYSDSAFVKGVMVDNQGKFIIPGIREGQYIISCSMLGYQNESRILRLSSDYVVDTVILIQQTSKLDEVNVFGKQQQITVAPDRLVFRPSEMNKQSTVYDLLQNLPGVIVDNQGKISLNGQENVSVMIDGRKQLLSGTALQSILQSMLGENVDCIELIEHPSVEMEAGGSAGIIEIKSRRGTYSGQALTARMDLQQGVYTHGSGSLNYAYQDKKFTLAADGGIYARNAYHILTLDKLYPDKKVGNDEVTCIQAPYTKYNDKNYFAHFSLDYNLSSFSYIGVYGNYNNYISIEDGNTVSRFYTGTHCDSMLYYTYDGNENKTRNIGCGVYWVYRDTLNRECKIFADYVHYNTDASVDQYTQFSDFVNNNDSEWMMSSNPGNEINIYSGQIDYATSLNPITNIKIGARSNYTDLSQSVKYWRESAGIREVDYEISNLINYDESISGAYIKATLTPSKKIQTNFGIRAEYTDIDGSQGDMRAGNDSTFNRSYLNWFPGASVQYALNENNVFGVQYNKRINRPGFRQLSPYVYVYDEYTYQKGNSTLDPEIIHNVNVSYTWRKALRFSFEYSKGKDVIILNFIRGSQDRVYILPENQPKEVQYRAGIDIFSLSPVKWWDYSLMIRGQHLSNSCYIDGLLEKNHSNNIHIQMNNKFSLPWKLKFELSGYYYSGFYKGVSWIVSQWNVWGGIGRSFGKGKGYISVYGRNIFDSVHDKLEVKHLNLEAKTYNENDDHYIGVTVSWQISKGKEIKKKDHGTSNNEAKRLNL